jgi:hypothetical protein
VNRRRKSDPSYSQRTRSASFGYAQKCRYVKQEEDPLGRHMSNGSLKKSAALLVSATVLHVAGCAGKATRTKPLHEVAPSSFSAPGKAERLVVLPAEGLPFPETASVLNQALTSARFSNVGEYVLAKVSMEVAQLSLECVEPSNPCYQSVGRFLKADRILWADVKSSNVTDGKAHSTVIIRLFDVEAGRPCGEAKQSYAGSPTVRDVDSLVQKALANATGGAGRR